ncbi:hypothetical protein AMJ52_03435 [candidate division TA06 bacterium DG_78]|uniref:Uncharacterized protein n=1 Tax=candidate division TA06 bacterium DG_78 TaxID=1703772 RepID=A0A0S7YG04_UNCT6|nr:MAG: hypothetical protein AMJ52_03435 [candidate division TA06 bacterium DG_78]
MHFIDFFNERVKKLTIFDVKLVQISAMGIILIIVKLIPHVMTINIWWFIVLSVICAIRPMYAFYFKK